MKKHIFILFLLASTYKLLAQQPNQIVKGKIITADDKPVSGLLVAIKGAKNVAYTQNDGTFKISSPPGKQTLLIYSINGFHEESIEVTDQLQLTTIKLKEKAIDLKEVVVTGQFGIQSLKNSVFNVRTINAEKIRLRAATNVQQILNTEFGFRFSNDLVLGTADIELMGMSGRNVKILLDGVPMVDRSDTRESLNQVDINTIERIEIVEGPLSVVYGTDALAGVINIITKTASKNLFNVAARIQDETAGDEYSALSGNGIHQKNINGSWQSKGWSALAGFTQNEFGGWNLPSKTASIAEVAAVRKWLPKMQFLGNAKIGYRNDKLNVWYRIDGVNEEIDSRGGMNINNFIAKLQTYTTNRFTQQLQSEWRISPKVQLTAIAGYTNLKRSTRTVLHNFVSDTEELSSGVGEQDIAKFSATIFRTTVQYQLSRFVAFQPGVEYNRDAASANRISGSPVISDYAFFLSSEIKLIKGINIRPGLRLIKNSTYDAPPIIPSLNTKFELSKNLALRLAYASGFRSPALRELYYNFVDASHTIFGNPNLKAEESNSFNGSLAWSAIQQKELKLRATLSGFYNLFKNRIDFGQSPTDPSATTLINVSRYKTVGGSIDQTIIYKNLQANLAFSYVGRLNNLFDNGLPVTVPEFVYSPEVTANLSYTFSRINTNVSLYYKYIGLRPSYQYNGATQTANLTQVDGFNWADLIINKNVYRHLTINAGIKNLFNITDLNNTSTATGGAHSTGGTPVAYSYGRSYLLGLAFNWNKN